MKSENNSLAVIVVDAHPRFYCEALVWLNCIKKYTSFRPAMLFINEVPENISKYALDNDVLVETAGTLIRESPHCNKILPYHIFGSDNVLVMDCDVFVTRDFQYMLDSNRVRLPQNNHCNPPMPVFDRILSQAGFDGPFEPGLALYNNGSTRETFYRNVSAGIIWVPKTLNALIPAWERWARWLIANREVMGRYKVHVDQVAIALALHELEVPFEHLPANTNAILHLLSELDRVYAFHLTSGHIPKFPNYFGTDGQLKFEVINPNIQDDCVRFNQALQEALPFLRKWKETKDFAADFLNPSWKRN